MDEASPIDHTPTAPWCWTKSLARQRIGVGRGAVPSVAGLPEHEHRSVLENLEAPDVAAGLLERLGPNQGVGPSGLHGARSVAVRSRRHEDEDASREEGCVNGPGRGRGAWRVVPRRAAGGRATVARTRVPTLRRRWAGRDRRSVPSRVASRARQGRTRTHAPSRVGRPPRPRPAPRLPASSPDARSGPSPQPGRPPRWPQVRRRPHGAAPRRGGDKRLSTTSGPALAPGPAWGACTSRRPQPVSVCGGRSSGERPCRPRRRLRW